MENSETSDSDSGSDLISLSLHRRKRAFSSSSDSSSSEFGDNRLVNQRKRFCGQFNLNESESEDNSQRVVISETDSEFSSPGSRGTVVLSSGSNVSSFENDSPEDESTATPTNSRCTNMIFDALQLKAKHSATDESDSGDEVAEKCPICLRGIKSQEVGSPEGCDHTFCLSCLVQWANSCNRCPLDRQLFKIILVRENLNGDVVRQMPVEETSLVVHSGGPEDETFCLLCGRFDNAETMLLCDRCDRGFHMGCLTPVLTQVPEDDEWFCASCSAWNLMSEQLENEISRPRDSVGRRTTPGRRTAGRTATPGRGPSRRNAPIRRSARVMLDRLSFFEGAYLQPSTSVGSPVAEDEPGSSNIQTPRRTRVSRVPPRRTKKRVKRRSRTQSRLILVNKRVRVENDDGTFTEQIIPEWSQVFRRRKIRRKKKNKKKLRANSRRAEPATNATAVRNRLARSLGMMPPAIPGQLIPEVCNRRRGPPTVRANMSRALTGIPTLHIFGPSNDLAPVSSGSEGEGMEGYGEVGLLSRTRVGMSTRPIARRKAIELLRSSARPRPRPAPQPCDGPFDLLSSILESQTIWHSRNSNVTVNNDGSVVHPNATVDVRNGRLERVAAAAPVSPTTGSQPGNLPTPAADNGGNSLGSSSTSTTTSAPSASATSPRAGMPRNDREGYANFLNNIPPGPTPFCRGGPPLRFRMPVRPQLRRIPLLPRRPPRHLYDDEDIDDPLNSSIVDENAENDSLNNTNPDEDVDLYSDIEANVVEKDEGIAEEDGNFPALGPPPEPPQFLLNLSMTNNDNESDVYDPAEPCDSDEEMVIDESKAPAAQTAPAPIETNIIDAPRSPTPPPLSATENCPVFRIYSSDSVAHSRKGEEERARELEENKLKMQQSPEEMISLPSSPKEKVGARLSFSVEGQSSADESQESQIVADKVDNCADDANVSEVDGDATVPRQPDGATSDPGSLGSPSSPTSPERARSARNSRDSQSGSRSPASDHNGRRRRISTNSRKSSFSPDNDRPSKTNRSRKSSLVSDNKSMSPKNRNESIANTHLSASSSLNLSGSPRDLQNDAPRLSTGLEGLDVEEVSSDMEDNDFNVEDDRLSSLSLSGLSDRSEPSPTVSKKKKRKKKRIKEKAKTKCVSEEGEVDSDKDKSKKLSKNNGDVVDENKSDSDKKKKNRSKSVSPDRQILGSKENKKSGKGEKEKDFAWKKPSKKEKNYREGRKTSKERVRNKDGRTSKSPSPKRGKKKSKDKKKIDKDKKKEIERYDVRKIVKNKDVRKKDAFGRDLPSKSLSLSRSPSKSRSRSPTPSRARILSRPRRNSRSPSRSPARGFRRDRRRFRNISRSPSPRRNKKRKSMEREERKTSRPRQPIPRPRRRSLSRSPRPIRGNRGTKKDVRGRKSWSRSLSLSSAPPSPTPPRMRNEFPPSRIRRSISPERIRPSISRSWSRGPSPVREPSLENLTVVLTSKDKKKKKKRKEDRFKKIDSKKKKTGNSKEVFASGDNVLVSVNFNRTSRNNNNVPVIITDISPVREGGKKKRRANTDDARVAKKSKTSNVSKTVVDAALSSQGAKRKKLTRLTEADADEILNRKPVAVIDLDISPYREQTPSPINVVVVSDSGSGEEGGKPTTPARTPSPDVIVLPPPATTNTQYPSSGPKTPPEPPLKFSISKPAQLRPIVNPLAEPDEEEEEEQTESLDGGNENVSNENQHKGPNTPPEPRGPSTPPRGPSTPKTPPSPQTSPDAYDPFEPTKSRSPSPLPTQTGTVDSDSVVTVVDTTELSNLPAADDNAKSIEIVDVSKDDARIENDGGDSNLIKDVSVAGTDVIEIQPNLNQTVNKSSGANKKTPVPTLAAATGSTLPLFSLTSSPNKPSSNRPQNTLAASGIQRLQHRLGSPVNKTPNSIKLTPEKRGPELLSTGNFKVRNAAKRNGPLQDATNETVEMDDSPYSPESCEGDDLFDPPPATPGPPQSATNFKTKNTPVKSQNKFDILFGSSGPNLSPMKNGGKKLPKGAKGTQKAMGGKGSKKGKRGAPIKMDEDQLRILDEVPSSAVELQVKDKFLKKLNRQERVVDEVKTVLKPHYARKHITKDEYKEILRRAVPKICHSKSGEINPSKIQHLVEAYVRKYRHNKKKGAGGVQKPKLKKTAMFS